jgi:hypothetical protein
MCEATRLPVGDTAGMTADEFMDQTLFIWVCDGAGQVSIGWWGKAGQEVPVLQHEPPASFHVRNIVVRINPPIPPMMESTPGISPANRKFHSKPQ